jgi:lytic murein transglycosylase
MAVIEQRTEARTDPQRRMAAGLTGLGLALLLVAGCSSTEAAAPLPPPPGAVATGPTSEPHAQSFPEWLAGLRAEAQGQGIAAATLDHAFAHIRLIDRVLELDATQPEFARPVWSYLDSEVSDQRVHQGYERLATNATLLSRVSAQFGVPGAILVAFWGIESDYGRDCGNFPVIDALATLAYRSRRPALFREELLAALHILDKGDIPLEQMRGSWAGAMGQTQFVPTIFLKHAVDYDQDGRRDIWNSLPDIFASTAHFVAGIGWRTGESWGQEVSLPAGFAWDQAELTITKPVSEWARLGVRPVRGPALDDDRPASILAPAGHTGPAFLVRENFRVIMRYNPSVSYALSVALLSDRITGGPPVAAAWPRQEVPLSRAERIEVQQRLAALGINPGATDSLIGPTTRTAVRTFQKTIGEIPDGFVTKHLLEALRHHAPGPA